jgi:hypothetical protein
MFAVSAVVAVREGVDEVEFGVEGPDELAAVAPAVAQPRLEANCGGAEP